LTPRPMTLDDPDLL